MIISVIIAFIAVAIIMVYAGDDIYNKQYGIRLYPYQDFPVQPITLSNV